ncbi:hypothetical protein ACNE9Y_24005 [Pseudomonas sp. NY11226]|uniref:hypothetical protein n=1 Tax=Pseudomonas sp. NY11226 TaxID=3400362 RepID=UPI003A8372EC
MTNTFDLDDINALLGGELESNTARIAVNEVKEANKDVVSNNESSIQTKIAELTELKKNASTSYIGKGNITMSEKSSLATKRGELMLLLDDRKPKASTMNMYFMMLGEELYYLASQNPELAQLVKNFGIPKP